MTHFGVINNWKSIILERKNVKGKTKMKVLFITRRFYPNGDASSAVVGNLALALMKKGVHSSVIALTQSKQDTKTRKWNGIDVRNIFVPELEKLSNLKKEWKRVPLRNGVTIVKKAYYKIKRNILPAYKKLSIDPVLLSSYKKILRKKEFLKDFDVCVATLMPHELIIAAIESKLKKPFVMYQLDTFWNNDIFTDEHSELRKKIEWEAVMSSAFVLTTPLIYDINKVLRPDLSDRIIAAEFPMITDYYCQNEERIENDKKCHCVFLGSLYPIVRPPEKVVNLISKIKNKDVVFDFYGDSQHLVTQSPEYPAAKGKIRLWGSISSQKAKQIRKSADILMNIDNTTLLQVPSKIFEYMCTGKPIINFYFNKNSSCLDYLKKYPLCLNIDLDSEADNEFEKKFEDFYKNSIGNRIPFEEIKTIFKSCTPEYVADQFLKCCKDFIPDL